MGLTISFETERKILYGVTGMTILGVIIMLVIVSTDYWVILTIPSGVYRNATEGYETGYHSGLWKICRQELFNNTKPVVKSK